MRIFKKLVERFKKVGIFDEKAKTKRTIKNIYRTLYKSLRQNYKMSIRDALKARDSILKIQGIHKDNFDVLSTMERFFHEKLNDVSIDDNSNKSEITAAGITTESAAPFNKLIGYDYLYRQMVEDYGKKEAKRLSGLMYDYSLVLADSTKILVPYCFALDTSKIVFEGRPWGQLHSASPKRYSSYISALNETIHQLSNHVAGALACSTFFLDSAYMLLIRENYSLDDIKNNEIIRKDIENCMQTFLHSMNSLSRSAVESPFTNLSIFDKPKLELILANDAYWYMFEDLEVGKDYVVDYITELQKIFVEFFDKGDPLKDGMQYRFPVVTANITKTDTDEVLDEEFLDYICNKDVYRYNIFVSSGTKVASCCRLINNSELSEMGGSVNSFGGTQISLGSHRVVTLNFNRLALECSSPEDFQMRYTSKIEDTVRILKAHKNLIEKLTEHGLHYFVANGWIRMDRLFSTIGIMGEYEAQLTLKERFPELKEKDLLKDWLIYLNDQIPELSKKYNTIINVEQIPGEGQAPKMAAVDKIVFTEGAVPFELYSNQFIPLWEDATIYERMELDGRYNRLITGGGIVHLNISEKTTPSQNKELIRESIRTGAEHFAINVVYSFCKNEHTTIGNGAICSICGEKIQDKFTRVVGFMVRVSDFNKVRREWEFPRRVFYK